MAATFAGSARRRSTSIGKAACPKVDRVMPVFWITRAAKIGI
jgi:hypothetical protein